MLISTRLRKYIEKRTGLEDMFSKRRTDEHVFARAVYFKARKDITGESNESMARDFGKKHLYARNSIVNVFPQAIKNLFYFKLYLECLSHEPDQFTSEGTNSEIVKDFLNKWDRYKKNSRFMSIVESIKDDEELRSQILIKFDSLVKINNKLYNQTNESTSNNTSSGSKQYIKL